MHKSVNQQFSWRISDVLHDLYLIVIMAAFKLCLNLVKSHTSIYVQGRYI